MFVASAALTIGESGIDALFFTRVAGDDSWPSVGYGEADVDRRDQGQRERVHGRRVEPPEAELRRGLDETPRGSPQHGRAQRMLR
jgi:hypothetical protein